MKGIKSMKKEEFIEKLTSASKVLDKDKINKVIENHVTVSDAQLNKIPSGGYNLIVAMEEMAELTQLVSKYLRNSLDRYDMLQEMADVSMQLEYLKLIAGISDEELNAAINVKLDRTIQRVQKEAEELNISLPN